MTEELCLEYKKRYEKSQDFYTQQLEKIVEEGKTDEDLVKKRWLCATVNLIGRDVLGDYETERLITQPESEGKKTILHNFTTEEIIKRRQTDYEKLRSKIEVARKSGVM
jgi:hypothetical protein